MAECFVKEAADDPSFRKSFVVNMRYVLESSIRMENGPIHISFFVPQYKDI